MTKENVEVVTALYEAWNAENMDAVREACDPEIIMRFPEDWPEPGPFVGREAVIRAFEQVRESFDADWQELITDPVDIGDRVVVRTVWHESGRVLS